MPSVRREARMALRHVIWSLLHWPPNETPFITQTKVSQMTNTQNQPEAIAISSDQMCRCGHRRYAHARHTHECTSSDGCSCKEFALQPASEPARPVSLHPATRSLVERFSAALVEKLSAAEAKYGYSDGWRSPKWMDECRAKLAEHVAKGDPRDVAAYCAFLWHHGESTAQPVAQPVPLERLAEELMAEIDTHSDNYGCGMKARYYCRKKILRALQQATAQKDAEIARLAKERDDYAEEARQSGEYIRKIGTLLRCMDGEDTPENAIARLTTERDAALQRCGELELRNEYWFGNQMAERAAHEATKQQLAKATEQMNAAMKSWREASVAREAMRTALSELHNFCRNVLAVSDDSPYMQEAEEALATPASVLVAQVREALQACKACVENEIRCCELNGRYPNAWPDLLTGCVSGGGIEKALQLIGEKA